MRPQACWLSVGPAQVNLYFICYLNIQQVCRRKPLGYFCTSKSTPPFYCCTPATWSDSQWKSMQQKQRYQASHTGDAHTLVLSLLFILNIPCQRYLVHSNPVRHYNSFYTPVSRCRFKTPDRHQHKQPEEELMHQRILLALTCVTLPTVSAVRDCISGFTEPTTHKFIF